LDTREPPARFGALATGFSALPAMVMIVFGAFFTAFSTDFLTFFYEMFCMLGMGGNKTGCCVTDFGTIPVQSDTLYHHLDVLFVQTGVRTHFTGGSALCQFLKQFFVMSHNSKVKV